MKMEALRLAYDESLKGRDTVLHRDVSARIDGRLGPSNALNRNWTNAVDCRSRLRQEKLERNLHGYMFIEKEPELGNRFSEVIVPQDVAVYGGLYLLHLIVKN
ncbi:hypothetical protein ABZP36_010316 [Zizania latifolia]